MSRDQAQRAAAACGSPQGLAASGAEQDPQPQQQAAPSGSFASAASSWSPPASSQLTAARDGARDAQRPPGNERRRRRSRERENRGERRNSSSTHGRHRHGCERDIQGAEDAGRGKDTRRHHHREGGEGERREDKREEGGRGHDRRDAEKRSSHVAQLRSGDSKAGRAPSRVRETGYCPEAYRRNASRGARRDGESRRERNDSERKQWGPRREEAPRAPHSGAPCSSERPGTQDGAARACEGSDIRGSCEARACHPARARDACRSESSLPRARGEESACRRAREEDLREEAQHRRRRDDAHVDSGRLGRHSRRASASRRDEGRPRNEKERRREGERERSASLHGWWRRESHGGRREDESRRSWTLAGQPERTPENEGRRTPSSHRHRSRKEERREEHHSRHASLEERPDKQERNHAPTELPQTDAARGVREKGKQTLEADRRRSSRGERDGQECRRKHRHREKHSSASPFSGSSSQRGSREHTPSSASPPLSSSLPSRETYPPFATCDANREGADAPSQRNPHTGTGEWRPGNFAVSAHAFVASAQASQPAGGIDNALSPPSVYPAACLPGSAAFSPGIFLSCTSTAGAAATDPAVYTVGPSAAPAVVLTPRAACAELSSQERFNFHSAELREGDASAGRAAAAHWDLLRAAARGPPQDRADGDASAAGATPGGVYTRAGLADALSPACVLRPRSSSDLPHRSGPEPSVSSGALCVEPERRAGASFAFAASAPPAPERPCKPSSSQSFFSSVAREEASSSSVPAPPRHALPSAASLSSAGAAPPPFSLSFAAQPQPQQRQDPQRADPGEPDWARNQGVSSLGRQPAAVPASRSQLRVFGSPTPSRPAPPAPPPPPPPPDASAPSRFAAVSVPGGGRDTDGQASAALLSGEATASPSPRVGLEAATAASSAPAWRPPPPPPEPPSFSPASWLPPFAPFPHAAAQSLAGGPRRGMPAFMPPAADAAGRWGDAETRAQTSLGEVAEGRASEEWRAPSAAWQRFGVEATPAPSASSAPSVSLSSSPALASSFSSPQGGGARPGPTAGPAGQKPAAGAQGSEAGWSEDQANREKSAGEKADAKPRQTCFTDPRLARAKQAAKNQTSEDDGEGAPPRGDLPASTQAAEAPSSVSSSRALPSFSSAPFVSTPPSVLSSPSVTFSREQLLGGVSIKRPKKKSAPPSLSTPPLREAGASVASASGAAASLSLPPASAAKAADAAAPSRVSSQPPSASGAPCVSGEQPCSTHACCLSWRLPCRGVAAPCASASPPVSVSFLSPSLARPLQRSGGLATDGDGREGRGRETAQKRAQRDSQVAAFLQRLQAGDFVQGEQVSGDFHASSGGSTDEDEEALERTSSQACADGEGARSSLRRLEAPESQETGRGDTASALKQTPKDRAALADDARVKVREGSATSDADAEQTATRERQEAEEDAPNGKDLQASQRAQETESDWSWSLSSFSEMSEAEETARASGGSSRSARPQTLEEENSLLFRAAAHAALELGALSAPKLRKKEKVKHADKGASSSLAPRGGKPPKNNEEEAKRGNKRPARPSARSAAWTSHEAETHQVLLNACLPCDVPPPPFLPVSPSSPASLSPAPAGAPGAGAKHPRRGLSLLTRLHAAARRARRLGREADAATAAAATAVASGIGRIRSYLLASDAESKEVEESTVGGAATGSAERLLKGSLLAAEEPLCAAEVLRGMRKARDLFPRGHAGRKRPREGLGKRPTRSEAASPGGKCRETGGGQEAEWSPTPAPAENHASEGEEADAQHWSQCLESEPKASKLRTSLVEKDDDSTRSDDEASRPPRTLSPSQTCSDPYETVDAGCPGIFLPTHSLEFPALPSSSGAADIASSVAQLSTRSLAAAGTEAGVLALFDVAHPSASRFVSLSASPPCISPSSTRRPQAFEGETGGERLGASEAGGARSDGIACLAWHPRAEFLGAGRQGGRLQIVDPRTRDVVTEWRAHRGPVEKLQFIGNNVCATSSSTEMHVRFWDLRILPSSSPSSFSSPSFSASSSFLSSAVGRSWNERLLRAVKADSGVSAFCVSPDEELFALATLAGEIQVMTSPIGVEPIEQLLLFPSVSELDCFSSLSFSPNNRGLLVQGERQHTQRMRDATRLLSYPFCELRDLQTPQQRAKLQTFASFWPELRRYPDYAPATASLASLSSSPSLSPVFDLPFSFFPGAVAVSLADNLLPLAAAAPRRCRAEAKSETPARKKERASSVETVKRDRDGAEDGEEMPRRPSRSACTFSSAGAGDWEEEHEATGGSSLSSPPYLLYVNASVSRHPVSASSSRAAAAEASTLPAAYKTENANNATGCACAPFELFTGSVAPWAARGGEDETARPEKGDSGNVVNCGREGPAKGQQRPDAETQAADSRASQREGSSSFLREPDGAPKASGTASSLQLCVKSEGQPLVISDKLGCTASPHEREGVQDAETSDEEEREGEREGEEREEELYAWLRASARVFEGDIGGDPMWTCRRFSCTFWRDKVVGVGGPLHLAGAMKLWDAATGFLDSCSISASSQQIVRSVASHPLGGPLVLSAGRRSPSRRACVTLWGYFTVDQLASFEMI